MSFCEPSYSFHTGMLLCKHVKLQIFLHFNSCQEKQLVPAEHTIHGSLAKAFSSRKKISLLNRMQRHHCVKSVRIRSFSRPYFPAFGLNTEIQSECGKIRTRKTPNTDIFHAACNETFKNYSQKFCNIALSFFIHAQVIRLISTYTHLTRWSIQSHLRHTNVYILNYLRT